MKNIKQTILALTAVGSGLFIMQSCEKDLPRYNNFVAYEYSGLDENAGTWQPIYLTSTSDTAIAAPDDITSAAYLAELDEVKGYAGALSSDEEEILDYWGNNTVIRWQEIAQELVAKYNLAPAPNADDTYSSPDPLNPSNYPNVPFAHPTYTCRAYAYLAAAQYDAILTAWHYKYEYNRPAPFKVDASVKSYYPENDIPSYPSEDAAIAEVSSEMLKFLFPLEADYLDQMADECRESRKWAGLNVESDLTAGNDIGGYVFRQYKMRAATDSMKFAQVNVAGYAIYETNADALYGDQWPHWENLEIPQRPVGITPQFGRVSEWWIPNVETVRPGPPPAIGSAEYKTAEQELLDYTKHCTTEEKESAYFWSDGFGTSTPTGHWNRIAAEYMISYRLNPVRTARIFAYLNTGMMDAGVSCWDTKYHYMYPRPSQGNPEIKALFGLPNFPSYTSGHSTFSGCAAEVLDYFFPAEKSTFDAYALDASNSRIYSRIHWRFDAIVGLEVGHNVGSYAIDRAKTDGAD